MTIKVFRAGTQSITDTIEGVCGFVPAVFVNTGIAMMEVKSYTTGNLSIFTWTGSDIVNVYGAQLYPTKNEAKGAAYAAALAYADTMNRCVEHSLDIGNFVPIDM